MALTGSEVIRIERQGISKWLTVAQILSMVKTPRIGPTGVTGAAGAAPAPGATGATGPPGELTGQLDGGTPSSVYGGVSPIVGEEE